MDGAIVLRNARGEHVELTPLGAAIVGVHVRDRAGTIADVSVSLGGSAGRTIGRYANRIARGTFELDGIAYRLSTNENGTTLHGGPDGFAKRNWVPAATPREGENGSSVAFALHSPDGDQGFPGALDVRIRYTFDDEGTLRLDYTATTSAATVVNLTNHVYFNLSAGADPSVAQHRLEVAATNETPLDAALIPTGAIAPVAGTDLDFRRPRALGEQPIDRNFVLDGWDGTLRRVACLSHAGSGRILVVETDQPGLQLFTGKPQGVALETQHFADSPNHPNFPTTTLRPGETFRSTTIYRFCAT